MTSIHEDLFDCLAPLSQFYASRDLERLHLIRLDGPDMPRPYRDLLVHQRDMTSTLSAYWNSVLQLRVLNINIDEHLLTREVVLVTNGDALPVEFGAIRIYLDRYDDAARAEIEACRDPLGAILDRHGVQYECRPNAYFQCESDATIQQVLGMDARATVYGRHNILQNPNGATLAEVVEILPPINSEATPTP